MTLLCPKDVAEKLEISPRTAQRLMQEGVIEACRVGPKLWRTTEAHLQAYIDRQFERYRRPVKLVGPVELHRFEYSVTDLRAA